MPPVIVVDHVTKTFRLGAAQGLKHALLGVGARLLGRAVEQRPLFKALDDVRFSVEPGEVLGIIGHNGAGKSTLLKLLAGISTPTTGSVSVKGRIAPLIEVGAGFVPDFTGRENVYLNGTILGMSKAEIDRKFDAIVDFAEIAEFIDTPVKRYSSGMQVKLAFAVATSVEAETLIVDEVLAVGDVAFQRKCLARMEAMIRDQGRTVLIVGHNIRQLERICTRMLLLSRGRIQIDGEPSAVSKAYFDAGSAGDGGQLSAEGEFRPSVDTGEVSLRALRVVGAPRNTAGLHVLPVFADLVVEFDLHCPAPAQRLEIHFGLHNAEMVYVHKCSSLQSGHLLDLPAGASTVRVVMNRLPLSPGPYGVGLGIYDWARRPLWAGGSLATISVDLPEAQASLLPRSTLTYLPTRWTIAGSDLESSP